MSESARAVTDRRCPNSEEGDFLARLPFFFYENGHNLGTKSQKIVSNVGMNRLSEGYKRAIDQNWGRKAKRRVLGQ